MASLRSAFWLSLVLIGFPVVCAPVHAQVSNPELPPARAAGLTELPVGPWGPYARGNSGPCYVLDRLQAGSLAFPIIVGQVRREVLSKSGKITVGRLRSRSIVERRAMGLSEVHAERDDEAVPIPSRNRQSVTMEADANGLMWRYKTEFAPAQLSQSVVPIPNADGKSTTPAPWGVGEALVEYFPAYVDPDADGLIVRVTITNRSAAPQEYVVDMLGGMNSVSTDYFPSKQLSVILDEDSGDVIVQHSRSKFAFALAAKSGLHGGTSHTCSEIVGDSFFSSSAAIQSLDELGSPIPFGILPLNARGADNKKSGNPAPDPGQWGLKRVSALSVAPGETITVYLAVGAGRLAVDAQKSAHVLLDQTGDIDADNKTKVEPAYVRALEAHRAAQFRCGAARLDGLVAQSLTNIPLAHLRRVGCPSKQPLSGLQAGTYDPEAGGMIALGWSFYRPDWSAAQINAWFLLTVIKPDTVTKDPIGVPPTNLMALWELYQKTHDKDLIARLYPSARRRYLELLAAGRTDNKSWLFSWKEAANDKTPAASSIAARPRFNSPDYSAYVIRSAHILSAIAQITLQSPEDLLEYSRNATEAIHALNDALWDETNNRFVSRSVDLKSDSAGSGQLKNLLPLIAGRSAITRERRIELLKSLADPKAFWSAAGLRSRAANTPDYLSNGKEQGAIMFEENWMLWKALLDLGETETAEKLASNLLNAYQKASSNANGFPELLDGSTGSFEGANDYSGSALALIPLYFAYHIAGTVSTGWDTNVTANQYDKAADKLHVELHGLAEGKSTVVCVLGKPHGAYNLAGASTGQVTADDTGAIAIELPNSSSDMKLEITPVGAGGSAK